MDIRMQLIHFRGHLSSLQAGYDENGLNMSREMWNLWDFFILPFIKSVGCFAASYKSFILSFSADGSLADLDLVEETQQS